VGRKGTQFEEVIRGKFANGEDAEGEEADPGCGREIAGEGFEVGEGEGCMVGNLNVDLVYVGGGYVGEN
jgi:hypothetical protein